MSFVSRILLAKAALGKRILLPVTVISLITLSGVGAVMIRYNIDSIRAAMDSKMEFAVNFLQHSGSSFLANYDLTALENFVRETEKDPDVAFAVFSDAAGKALTQGTKDRNQDTSALVIVSRELKEADGKILGTVKVAYTNSRVTAAVRAIGGIVIGSVLLVMIALVGALLVIVRSVNGNFRRIVERLSEASITISATSDEMSSSSESLSKGVTKQAAAVQETVASMAEMSSMLAQTASNARGCHTLTAKVADKTRSGTDIMEQMVTAMGSIENANSQLHNMVNIIRDISAKTNVINDIVFKTQLLSLNASIEAARAGQHGRGFAVVAEEVGNLAQLSGSAAKEISALLESSERDVTQIVKATEQRVKEGREVSDRARKTFNEISSDINSISKQIQSINEAAREQEQGVMQSSNAMVLVDETTHQNSNVAKQAHSSSQLLAEQSKRIQQITTAIRQLILGAETVSIPKRFDSLPLGPESSTEALNLPGDSQIREGAVDLAERIARRADTPASASSITELSDVGGSDFDASDESFQQKRKSNT